MTAQKVLDVTQLESNNKSKLVSQLKEFVGPGAFAQWDERVWIEVIKLLLAARIKTLPAAYLKSYLSAVKSASSQRK